MSLFQRTLFIFRRDLRLEDNTGLIFALKNSKEVICAFIFTPQQIRANPYLGPHSLQFLLESLEDLEKQLEPKGGKLYLFYDEPHQIVSKCILQLNIDAVVVNCDYTPYSIERDRLIQAVCEKEKIAFHSLHDALLHPPQATLKKNGKPYVVFTPFYRNSSKLDVKEPVKNNFHNYYKGVIGFSKPSSIYGEILPKRELPSSGGREKALHILKNMQAFINYESTRNFPAQDNTTHLSAHLKFTTCSPREVYQAISQNFGPFEVIRSLYWRDFFTIIAFYFPQVFKGAFDEKYNTLQWSGDLNKFERWCKGETGFPIVDAGMRELNQTGFMHNRVRMIVASFLIKDLHINWQWGEKYFAQQLSDYDPAINNGNWQWVASTGCDAQPYFRIFNPWNQSIKFDAECIYIKKWIPQLADVPPKTIHNWHKQTVAHNSYPIAMLEHSYQAKISLERFTKAAKN